MSLARLQRQAGWVSPLLLIAVIVGVWEIGGSSLGRAVMAPAGAERRLCDPSSRTGTFCCRTRW